MALKGQQLQMGIHVTKHVLVIQVKYVEEEMQIQFIK